MKTLGILVIVLACLVMLTQARPAIFVAELRDAYVNQSNNWSGVAMAFTTHKGAHYGNRLSIFGAVTVSSAIIKVTLVTQTGQFIGNLKWNNTLSSHLQYVFGAIQVNSSSTLSLLRDQLGLIIYTTAYPTGAVGGLFYLRPYTFMAAMSYGNVVGAGNATNNDLGLGLVNIYPSATTFPTDIVQADNTFLSTLVVAGRIVYDASNVTSGTLSYGQYGVNGATLNTFTAGYYSYVLTNGSVNLTTISYLYNNPSQGYLQINSGAFPNGDVRGQLYPLVTPRRRVVPTSFTPTTGSITGNLASLYRATQYLNNNNKNSYVSLNPTNGSFDGYFLYQLPFNKVNLEDVRMFTLNMNARATDGSTWSIYYYNYFSSAYELYATFTSKTWQLAFLDNYDYVTFNYISSNGFMRIRVTSTAATVPLSLDEFTIRPWAPSVEANSYFRSVIRNLKISLGF